MVKYKVCFHSEIGSIATVESVISCHSDTFPSPDSVKKMIKNLNSEVSQKFSCQTGISVNPEDINTCFCGIYF